MKQKKDDTLGMPESMMPDRGHRTGLGPKYVGVTRTSTGMSRRNTLVVLVALVVVVGAAVFIVRMRKPATQSANPVRTDLAATEIPAGIPTDLPYINFDDAVVHNFSLSATDTAPAQTVRKWTADGTVEVVYAAYKAYFHKKDWQVMTEINTDAAHIVSARKDGHILMVSFAPTNNTVLIEASAQ